MKDKILAKLDYYLFIQKYQMLVSLSILFFAGTFYSIIKSSFVTNIISYLIDKYVIWKYGSISALDLLSPEQKYDLLNDAFCFFGSISFFLMFVIIIYAQIYINRKISFKKYAIHKSQKLSDDIGFSITYFSLIALFNYPLNAYFDWMLYKAISVYFIQCIVFHLLLTTKAYAYSVRRRYKPLKT